MYRDHAAHVRRAQAVATGIGGGRTDLDPDGKPAAGADITRTIHLRGPLDAEQRERLLQIANACPIHRLLTGEVRVASTLGD